MSVRAESQLFSFPFSLPSSFFFPFPFLLSSSTSSPPLPPSHRNPHRNLPLILPRQSSPKFSQTGGTHRRQRSFTRNLQFHRPNHAAKPFPPATSIRVFPSLAASALNERLGNAFVRCGCGKETLCGAGLAEDASCCGASAVIGPVGAGGGEGRCGHGDCCAGVAAGEGGGVGFGLVHFFVVVGGGGYGSRGGVEEFCFAFFEPSHAITVEPGSLGGACVAALRGWVVAGEFDGDVGRGC